VLMQPFGLRVMALGENTDLHGGCSSLSWGEAIRWLLVHTPWTLRT